MTYANVFIYQQQTCVFATVLAFLNSFIAPEYRILKKVGGVTISIYFSSSYTY